MYGCPCLHCPIRRLSSPQEDHTGTPHVLLEHILVTWPVEPLTDLGRAGTIEVQTTTRVHQLLTHPNSNLQCHSSFRLACSPPHDRASGLDLPSVRMGYARSTTGEGRRNSTLSPERMAELEPSAQHRTVVMRRGWCLVAAGELRSEAYAASRPALWATAKPLSYHLQRAL